MPLRPGHRALCNWPCLPASPTGLSPESTACLLISPPATCQLPGLAQGRAQRMFPEQTTSLEPGSGCIQPLKVLTDQTVQGSGFREGGSPTAKASPKPWDLVPLGQSLNPTPPAALCPSHPAWLKSRRRHTCRKQSQPGTCSAPVRISASHCTSRL